MNPYLDPFETEGDKRVRRFMPFYDTLDFFEKELNRKVVLAGGCIRDMWKVGPVMIKDYDVWVLGVQDSEISDLDKILASTAEKMHPSEQKAADANYPDRNFHAPKLNLFLPCIPDGKVAQVIYTQSPTMEKLLAEFDWHVCSFGFDGKTVVSDGATDFDAHTLTLNPENALRSARSTLRRGFHLEDKFRGTAHRLKMPNETILALAAMLTLSGENRKDPEA
jgi:hypothetical protein